LQSLDEGRARRTRLISKASFDLTVWYVTSLISLFSVSFAHQFVRTRPHALAQSGDVWNAFANWDGRWYRSIAEIGYRYEPGRQSSVAFFPAYPMAARFISAVTGIRIEFGLIVTSQLALLCFFVVWLTYLRDRLCDDYVAEWTLVGMATFPITIWWRMAYSESLFLCCAALAFHAMQRRYSAVWIALIIGLCTATRPVGVCLVLPFAIHICGSLEHSWRGWLRASALATLSCWGIVAFMVYLGWEFGEPFAFIESQDWRVRPPTSTTEKLLDLTMLEPIWNVFVPSSAGYWGRPGGDNCLLLSIRFMNPIYFVIASCTLVIAARNRWLNSKEIAFCTGMLLLPYLTRAHETYMESMGRYVGASVPLYIAIGRLYSVLPPHVSALLIALSSFFLGAYTALFAAWHHVY
jgi:hypothetical protein